MIPSLRRVLSREMLQLVHRETTPSHRFVSTYCTVIPNLLNASSNQGLKALWT